MHRLQPCLPLHNNTRRNAMNLPLSALASRTVRRAHPRRGCLLAGAMLAAALAWPPAPAQAQGWTTGHWTCTWGAGADDAPAPGNTQLFSDQTLRLIVHTSIGGNRVRIRLSNEMGTSALRIGAAHIAVRAGGAELMPGTDRALTFGGAASVTIPAGMPVLSDPVELNVAALSDLAISLYLPGAAVATTTHASPGQASYVSLPGDFTGAAALPTQRAIASWPFLTEVDVDSGAAAIVTLGDSITEGGRGKPGAADRWPDLLAQRMQALRDPILGLNGRLGVVNRGTAGNRLLSDPAKGAPSRSNALARFERDVLATAGVRYVTVLLGMNDIRNSPERKPVSANELIAAYRQLIARAHENGIAVFGATLTPFEGAAGYSPAREQLRATVNNWIRSNGEFDGVIDFDLAMRDPAHGARLLPAYDSGDHLHPNQLGYRTMGNAVPLALFRAAGPSALQAPPTAR
jgi:lysophospholipase L1-like esterase